jgi:glycosyltransferase involved in cell wall biosynthesis
MQKDNLLFSIVTPSMNSEKYIEETIQSVINQTYKNIEYIIIDGGSTDATIDIIGKYKNRISKIISEPDRGMYDAINKGINVSNGRFFTYLNSDDCLHRDSISKVVSYFSENENIEFLYGSMDFIDSNSKYLYSRNYPKIDWKNYASCNYSMIGQPSSFWRRSVFDKVGIFDTNYTMLGDTDFFTRILKKCSCSNTKESFSKFRIHSQALTLKNKDKHVHEHNTLHLKYLNKNVPMVRSFLNNMFFKIYNFTNYIQQIFTKRGRL